MARASLLPDWLTRSRTLCAVVLLLLASALTIPPIAGYWIKPASGLAHAEGQRVQPALEMLAHGPPQSSREAMDAWLVPHLFGQAYLRKPPGMVWAIAASQTLFGESSPLHCSVNVAGRLVSAFAVIAGALMTFVFASRWFGRKAGFVAGCAWALFPVWYWYPPPALSAEIEGLNNLFVFGTSLALIDVLLWSRRRKPSGQRAPIATNNSGSPRVSRWLAPSALWTSAFLTLCFAAMLLTKGPAGIPTLLAVMIACTWGRAQHVACHSRREWLTVAICLTLGALVFGGWLLAARGALARSGETPVTQEFTQFLFTPKKFFGILSLPVAALISSLPHAAFLSVFVRPSQRLRASPDPLMRRRVVLSQTLAASLTLGVILSMFLGVHNPRYTLPTLTLMPLCVGAACWWLYELGRQSQSMQLGAKRTRELTRTLCLLAGLLLIACVALGVYAENRRTNRTTGETDGTRMGEWIGKHTPTYVRNGGGTDAAYPIQLWGDEMLDIRPEIVMAATREASKHGVTIVAKWKPLSLVARACSHVRADHPTSNTSSASSSNETKNTPSPTNAPTTQTTDMTTCPCHPPSELLPPEDNYVLLRTDTREREPGRIEELGAYERAGLMSRLRPVFKGTAHDFEYTLYVVLPHPISDAP